MTHPNAQLLRANYQAFSNGDVNPLLQSCTDDVAWHCSGRSPVAGDYSGKDEVLRFFGDMMALYGGTLQLEVLDLLANDRRGVVLTRERGEHAGAPIEFDGVHLWEFRDGKCTRFENYTDDVYDRYWS